jgi:iron complex transport system substrate-binding protein
VVGLFIESYHPFACIVGEGLIYLQGVKERKIMLKKIGLVILAAVVFTGLMASCGKTPESTTAASPAVIKDQLGRTVTLTNLAPQRIISLAPSNTEILFALGLGDRVVGVTDYCNYPPEAKTKPSIGDYNTPNLEEIIVKQPDLVLATEVHQAKLIPLLESRDLTVIGLSPKNIDDVLAAIILVGKITGKDKEAAKLTAAMQKRIESVTDKTSKLSGSQKPRVFYTLWYDSTSIWTAGAGSFEDELIQKAGGVNIAHDLNGYVEINQESVIMANPETIIAGVGMGTGEDLPLQFVKTEPLLKDTDARKNDRIYGVNMDIVGRPGPRIVDALEVFLAAIHPELQDQP